MKQSRTLSLRRESLAELSPTDLSGVAGAAPIASFADGGCVTDLPRDSYRICSFRCEWTFNTCE